MINFILFIDNVGLINSRDLLPENETELNSLLNRCEDYYLLVEGKKPSQDAGRVLMNQLPKGKTTKDKHVVGVFCMEKLIGVVDLISDFPARKYWYIGVLLIDPIFRNKGIGSIIIKQLAEYLKNKSVLNLEIGVVTDNVKAIHFWQKMGFKEIDKKCLKIGEKIHTITKMNLILTDN